MECVGTATVAQASPCYVIVAGFSDSAAQYMATYLTQLAELRMLVIILMLIIGTLLSALTVRLMASGR